MNPVSDALECLNLRCWIPGRFELTAPWGLRFDTRLGWFHLVLRPPCRLAVDGLGSIVNTGAGDLVIVFPGHKHTLLGGDAAQPKPIHVLLQSRHFQTRDALTYGGGGALTRLISGCFLLEGIEHSPICTALPAPIHLPSTAGGLPYLNHVVRLLELEAAVGEGDRPETLNRLMRILLHKALQQYVLELPAEHANWLAALADAVVGRALALMHAQPEKPWTVATLAAKVAMARSTFSARFTQRVGIPPLEYLTRWRLQKAGLLLRTTRNEVKEIAARVGYESTSAFSKAFARWAGVAPGAYRRAALPAQPAHPELPPF